MYVQVVVTCDDLPHTISIPVDHRSVIMPWLHNPVTVEMNLCTGGSLNDIMTVHMADKITLSRPALGYLSNIVLHGLQYPWHYYTFDSPHLSDFIGISRIADFLRCYGLMEILCPVDTDHALGLLLAPDISDEVKMVWINTIKWFEDVAHGHMRVYNTVSPPGYALRYKSLNTARWAIVESKSHPDYPECLTGYFPQSQIGALTRTHRLSKVARNAVRRLLSDLPGASDAISVTCPPAHDAGHVGGWVISGGFVRDLMVHETNRDSAPFIPKDIDFFLTSAYFGTGLAPTTPLHRAVAVLEFVRSQLECTDGWIAVQTKRVITLRHQQSGTSIQLVMPSNAEKEMQEEPFRRFDIDACRGMLMRGSDLGGFPYGDIFVNGTTAFFKAIACKKIRCTSRDVTEHRLIRHMAKGWKIDASVTMLAQYNSTQTTTTTAPPPRTSPHDIEYTPGMSVCTFLGEVYRQHKHVQACVLSDLVESVTAFVMACKDKSISGASVRMDAKHPWLNIAEDITGDDYYAWGAYSGHSVV